MLIVGSADRRWYDLRNALGTVVGVGICWWCHGEACRYFRVMLRGLCRKRHVVDVCRETALGIITIGSALLIVRRVLVLVITVEAV